jgi:hypothetical protein
MSSVIVAGNTSGSVTLDAPAVSGSTVITLPTASGTMAATDTSGNLGIGVTPSAWGTAASSKAMQIGTSLSMLSFGASGQGAHFGGNTYWDGTNWKYLNSTGACRYEFDNAGPSHKWYTAPSGTAGNNVTFTQAMTLNASGNLSVASNVASGFSGEFVNGSATAPAGLRIYYSGVGSGSGGSFIYAHDTGALRFNVAGNGNVTNVNNSYGAISDIKLKENIIDTSPKLDKLLQVKIRNYNLKTEPDQKQIGVIAQELETVFPSLIEETEDKDKDNNDLGTTTKAVKYSVFVPILIKAIQELKAIVDTQAEQIKALQGVK